MDIMLYNTKQVLALMRGGRVPKGTPLRTLLLTRMDEPVFPKASVESGFPHAATFNGIFRLYFSSIPSFDNLSKVLWRCFGRTSKMHTSRFCGGNALCLALFYVLSLGLSYEAEDLENEISDEGAHEVFPVPGVQQWHVDHADVNAYVLRENAPLALNLLVVASQPVDAEDVQ